MDIEDWVMHNETMIRLSFFLSILVTMAGWEILYPRRKLIVTKSVRWMNNLALVILNNLLLRLLFPFAAVGLAAIAIENKWGLFNIYQVPFMLAVVVSIIVLDLVIYLQHLLVHAVPILWRLHRVHHADLDIDVTTGARFHPLEIIFSMLIKLATILLLGPPLIAVVVFEIMLSGMSMFNHGNVRLPIVWDKKIRLFLVTPDMHRVHHSIEDDETNSNFGFSLSIWDRVFGTYRDQPRDGHRQMTIGIQNFQKSSQVSSVPAMLMLPFVGKTTTDSIKSNILADIQENDKNEK